jgi:nucleoid-associated protein YgaU
MHAALFSEHHAVALILDPTINARAWFGWTLTHLPFDQETPESGQREAAAAAMAEARAGGLRRRSAASVLAAGLVVGALGGYLGGTATRQPTRTHSVRGTPVPTPEATRLRAQLETLKQQLRTNAERIAAADRKLQETKAQLRAARLATRPRVLMFRYRARPGDSLWRVAQIFYGTGLKWQLVWKANPSIHDPSRIQVGQILKVPLRTG